MTDFVLTADDRSPERKLQVYESRRGRQWRNAAILLVLGLIGAAAQGRPVMLWAEGGAMPSARALYLTVSSLICLAGGILAIASALRGRPRLSVTPTGIRLETITNTQWADWSSLGPLALTTISAGPLRRGVRTVSAAIVGPAASANLLRRKRLVLTDSYRTPLDAIVANLTARQSAALGIAARPAVPGEAPVGLGDRAPLWLTLALIGLLACVFIGEQIFAVGPPIASLHPSLSTLVALGGLTRPAVLGESQWYRLFTAPLLHADLAHIAANAIALLMAGALLERLVGRVWFLTAFVLGGLGGALASLALNPATIVSVGASGAIMGLFGTALVCSFRLPAGSPARSRMQGVAARVLLVSLLPLATAGTHIDYGAHLGGAVSGVLLGLLLLKTWPDGERLPQLRKLAASVASAGFILAAVSAAAVAARYPSYVAAALLIPQSELPKTQAEMVERGPFLAQRYPGDPRASFYRAMALVAGHDYPGAEHALRLALEQSAGLKLLGVRAETTIRAELVAVLLEEQQREAAKEAARMPCRSAEPTMRQALIQEQLCGDGATPP